MKNTLELAARYLTTLRAVEQAHMLGDEDALISILASVDPIDVQECARELRALAVVRERDTYEPTPRNVVHVGDVWSRRV